MPKTRFCFTLIVLFLVIWSGCIASSPPDTSIEPKNTPRACFEKSRTCFEIEIADTAEKQTRGLMERTQLDDNQGMLFVFDQPQQRAFWMKNTLIPLDMIWIDDTNHVIGITTLASPCENDPCPLYQIQSPSQLVLEIPGGRAINARITPGDKITIHFA